MSRHIWSVKTFKKRVGKSVTVDGAKCTVSEKDGRFIIHAKDGKLHLELEAVLLKPWLRNHVVVASGYPLKRESSKPAKGSYYTRDLRDIPYNVLVTVKFEHLKTQAEGMFIKDHERSGQMGTFFVSNDSRLDGCPCQNRRGFEYSYLISSHNRSAYGLRDIEVLKEQPVSEPVKEPVQELYRITYGSRKCFGRLKKAGDGTYIITDNEAFAGASTSDEFREGFKYSWWVSECNVEDVKLEPLSGPVKEPVQEPVKADVLDMTIRELLELVVAKLKA